MRSEAEVDSLFHELRTRIWDDYSCDITTFNLAWVRLVREVLRTAKGNRRRPLIAGEWAVTVCRGLVTCDVSGCPELFRLSQVRAWVEAARSEGRFPSSMDAPTFRILSKLGYSMLRGWGEK